MAQSDPVVEPLRFFIHRLEDASPGTPKPKEALRTVATDLQGLSAAVRWDECHYRQAVGPEELVYEIARASEAGPTLYLVSDGAGVSSPPHEHLTWAVIVGISGAEVNVVYELTNAEKRLVRPARTVLVAKGDVLVLETGAIHSTLVASRRRRTIFTFTASHSKRCLPSRRVDTMRTPDNPPLQTDMVLAYAQSRAAEQ